MILTKSTQNRAHLSKYTHWLPCIHIFPDVVSLPIFLLEDSHSLSSTVNPYLFLSSARAQQSSFYSHSSYHRTLLFSSFAIKMHANMQMIQSFPSIFVFIICFTCSFLFLFIALHLNCVCSSFC